MGQWEVKQLSEITGDSSVSGTIQCRLSIVTCKAAFMDSQKGELVGAGQQQAGVSEGGLLDFDEFQECISLDLPRSPHISLMDFYELQKT